MRLEFPQAALHSETLAAVAMGALLATLGGFCATLLEAHVRRRELQRLAALTFGEVLASLQLVIGAISEAHGRGEPFGALTLRLVRAASREIETYERNRPALSDLRSPDLRLAIHGIMVRLALAMEGMLESSGDDERQRSYQYMLDIAPQLGPLVERLVPLAGQPIEPYEAVKRAAGAAPLS
jgi:hypothetical protein